MRLDWIVRYRPPYRTDPCWTHCIPYLDPEFLGILDTGSCNLRTHTLIILSDDLFEFRACGLSVGPGRVVRCSIGLPGVCDRRHVGIVSCSRDIRKCRLVVVSRVRERD